MPAVVVDDVVPVDPVVEEVVDAVGLGAAAAQGLGKGGIFPRPCSVCFIPLHKHICFGRGDRSVIESSLIRLSKAKLKIRCCSHNIRTPKLLHDIQ